MTIDPLETVIAWLTTALTSVDGRVAGKHQYGGAWAEAETGVVVRLEDGPVDLYAEVAMPKLEVRIYAKDDQTEVVSVWRELIGLSRDNRRFTQDTGNGTALIQYFLPETGLSLTYDETLAKELGIVFFKSMISEAAVP